jgi:Skp family chaperone for outer membrane proteins
MPVKPIFMACAASLVLVTAPAFAQAPSRTPAQKPTPPAAPTALPFPDGAKVAYIVPERIVVESELGRSLTARVNSLRSERLAELTAKNKELEAAQQKLAGGSVLSETARATTQTAADRLQIELQRAQQDAEAAVQELQQQINGELERAVTPVLQQVALDRGILLLFRSDSGAIAWAAPAIDLTGEVVKRLNASSSKPTKRP